MFNFGFKKIVNEIFLPKEKGVLLSQNTFNIP